MLYITGGRALALGLKARGHGHYIFVLLFLFLFILDQALVHCAMLRGIDFLIKVRYQYYTHYFSFWLYWLLWTVGEGKRWGVEDCPFLFGGVWVEGSGRMEEYMLD
jgi:hypothetical protein